MLDNGCCDNSGGRVTVTIDGKRYSSRGGIEFMPTNINRGVGANDDGSIYTTTQSVPATAKFTLSDKCGLSLEQLVAGCKVDVTFDQLDMRRKLLYTQATIIGRPSMNSESGAISGLEVAAPRVTEVTY